MRTVIAAIYPRALATSLTLPMDVLAGASEAARAAGRDDADIRFRLAATSNEPVTTAGGMTLTPDLLSSEISQCDLLILPGMWRNPRPVVRSQRAWIDILHQLHARDIPICAVGTGSCFLAEAGLLNGLAATTHWNYFDRFTQDYPLVDLKQRHLITQAGQLYCAGSVNSIADLMIHILEDWFGPLIARAVENQFSPEIRRPFRAHAFQHGEDPMHHDELVLEAQQWLQEHLHESITVDQLASVLNCAKSTLARRFKQATGRSPSRYLQDQRILSARELLRATNLSVSEVAWQVGLQDVSYFTKLFRQHTGMPPARYRQSARGKLFKAQS